MTRAAPYLEFAQHLADIARPIAQRYFRANVPISQKADNSPVTIADQEIEQAIRAAIANAYPEHGIYGEEAARHLPDAVWQWVIDPIDGTRAFIQHEETFTTLIALCYDGLPVLGVIDQPIRSERWVGTESEPTMYNAQPLPSGENSTARTTTISTTSHRYFTLSQQVTFDRLAKDMDVSHCNNDAYAYGMLANGTIDIVIDAAMKPYDFLALAPVVEGTGGTISDWKGEPLRLNSNGNVLACRSQLQHQDLIEKLKLVD